jgi:tetratricopeptide (TPR) repeat protein
VPVLVVACVVGFRLVARDRVRASLLLGSCARAIGMVPESAAAPVAPADGTVDSDKLAAKRTDYYRGWDKFANESVAKTEEEAKKEAEAAARALGIRADAPKSEAEEKDLAKRAALKEAKKLWDNKKLHEEAKKMTLGQDHVGQDLVLSESVLDGRRVVHLTGAKNSKYTIHDVPARLVKIFIENCEGCAVDVAAETISQHIEIAHCSDCTVTLHAPSAVVQMDLCEKVEVRFAPGTFARGSHKVYHAGIKDSRVVLLDDGHEHTVDYEAQGAEEQQEKKKEEFQFVTHWVDDKLVTEPVFRSKGNMPLTKAEIERAERLGDGDGLQSDERLAELKKTGGNEAFAEGNYAQAAIFYTEAIDLAAPDSPLRAICFANRSFANMKLGRLPEALDDADEAILADPTYVKGHFRRGLALHALKRYRDAAVALSKALDMEPGNKQIKEALGFADMHARKTQAG